MYFTTQKQQMEESNRLKKEERMALVEQVLKTLFEYFCAALVMLAPALALALGWIKG